MDVAHLQVATVAHLRWKSKLADFFYGLENLTVADVPDHMSCDFGQWLYKSGLEEFAAYSEMGQVESLHKDFHAAIKRLVQMPEAERKSPAGKEALSKFKAQCDEFIRVMEQVESQAAKDSI
ncbi:MAG: CZB domain-containing protein [Candidatus Electrothrix sp. GW3-4]|uniref:CZB domain-containing protein n=1 Tax=Candidatus Electrothrix sp. GW3-4 TaxID=3126740 RepID=UPI0030D1F669